jgi:hypothetical protein
VSEMVSCLQITIENTGIHDEIHISIDTWKHTQTTTITGLGFLESTETQDMGRAQENKDRARDPSKNSIKDWAKDIKAFELAINNTQLTTTKYCKV